ncbi:Hsp33 family molecular chaperone HslO [Aerococcaceae bacterium zg-ZJ1578]|uniref:Hsp33 family molecular chaperone HslO n=1 Tax=Aerococcaceae bacterium zg-252 TaxID=2796928 RepID=UPI001A2081E9|nr:Hsp33 family molecular chaperone HslO [Aerococcaceae bacterium zg-1578]MBR7926593.1 Hsp33 family molecular chaperone HslO [Aerococcaceae bacterium zg-ZUI334]MBS4461542.1 Hsp33 family molecular chaperone HslO [Aerococcaceae bacterium zg-B36]
MTDQILKALAFDGQVRVFVLDLTQSVDEAHRRHDTWHTATAALGRTLVATSLLASNLKGEDRISVEILGEGPVGRIITDGDSVGNVRGYIQNPHVALELNSKGKLDVAGAVGLPGTLTVRKYITGTDEPFSGQVPMISGELAEDFTYYMAISEQTPSSIGLSVLVNPDESVAAAGGFMIQVMPGATEETITILEQRINAIGRFSDLLDQKKPLEELLDILVGEGNSQILDKHDVAFYCPCSKERFANSLKMIGNTELQAIIDEDGQAETVCHYCNEHYHFTKEELESLLTVGE